TAAFRSSMFFRRFWSSRNAERRCNAPPNVDMAETSHWAVMRCERNGWYHRHGLCQILTSRKPGNLDNLSQRWTRVDWLMNLNVHNWMAYVGRRGSTSRRLTDWFCSGILRGWTACREDCVWLGLRAPNA